MVNSYPNRISLPRRESSRRTFLKHGGAIAAGSLLTIVPRHVLGGPGHLPPSEKTTLAGIGTGGQGLQNMLAFQQMPEIQVLAVCDVNRSSGGYLSWNWTQGKEQRLSGREPARRAIEIPLAGNIESLAEIFHVVPLFRSPVLERPVGRTGEGE